MVICYTKKQQPMQVILGLIKDRELNSRVLSITKREKMGECPDLLYPASSFKQGLTNNNFRYTLHLSA